MGEIDDAGKVEYEGKSERHECIERADDQAIKDIEQYQLRHLAISRPIKL
jgi:hypothetical protein